MAECMVCGFHTTIGDAGMCRLCSVEGRRVKEPGRAVDLAVVSRNGQQLYLANLHHTYVPRGKRHRSLDEPAAVKPPQHHFDVAEFTPVKWR